MIATEEQFFYCSNFSTITQEDDKIVFGFGKINVYCDVDEGFRKEFTTFRCSQRCYDPFRTNIWKCEPFINSCCLSVWCEHCHGEISHAMKYWILGIYLKERGKKSLQDLYNDKYITIDSIEGEITVTDEERIKRLRNEIASNEKIILNHHEKNNEYRRILSKLTSE